MSVDTYFCFCCLSTVNLINLYDAIEDTTYANMLQNVFSIKLSELEYNDDICICRNCGKQLTDASAFKTLIFGTLNILQLNGLLTIHQSEQFTIVKKMGDDDTLDEDIKCVMKVDKEEILMEEGEDKNSEFMNIIHTELDLGIVSTTLPPQIKEETIDASAASVELKNKMESTQMYRPVREREKRITVTRRKKGTGNTRGRAAVPLYTINENLKCDFCSETMPNLNVYHRHMNLHFPNHVCETCGKAFPTLKKLKRHIVSHAKGPFVCDACDTTFTNYNTYSVHKRRKHGTLMLYKCTDCAERFQTLNRKMIHLAEVHGRTEKKYKCGVCAKEFSVSSNLSQHMRRTHLKVERYFCTTCEMGFHQKSELTNHTVVHTGVRKFHCDVCTKGFLRKKNLKDHMKRHVASGPRLPCRGCTKTFLRKHTLENHVKRFHHD